MSRTSLFALASLVLVAGCDTLFGLRELSPAPADAMPMFDGAPDAAPCVKYGYPGVPLADVELAPFNLAVGDIDGDTILDVVATNYNSNSISVLVGRGDGTYGQQRTYGTGTNPRGVTIGDLNDDGHNDVVVTNQGAGTIGVYLNDGTGMLGAPTPYTVGSAPVSVAIADLDNNGTQRLVRVAVRSDRRRCRRPRARTTVRLVGRVSRRGRRRVSGPLSRAALALRCAALT